MPAPDHFGEIIHVSPVKVQGDRCPLVQQAQDPVPGEAVLLRLLPAEGGSKEGP